MKPAQPSFLSPSRALIYLLYTALIYFVIALSIWLVDDHFSYNRGPDSAAYILLAESIAEGYGYADINDPDMPAHTQYPPLFSLVLSPVVYLLGYNFMWMRIVVLVFVLASLYLIKRIMEREGGLLLSLGVVLLTATNPAVIFFSREIAPEMPYLFFSLLSVVSLQGYVDRRELKAVHWLIPFVLPLAYMTKLIGLSLCAAVIFALVIRILLEDKRVYRTKKFFYFYFLSVSLLPLVLWFSRNVISTGGASAYLSIFLGADYYDAAAGSAGLSGIMERVKDNLLLYSNAVPASFLTWLGFKSIVSPLFYKGLLAFTLLSILAGLIYGLIWKRRVMDFYMFSFLMVLLVWPVYGEGDARRYLVLVLPFLYFYFFQGIMLSIGGYLKGVYRFKGAVLLPFLLLLFFNVFEKKNFFRPDAVFQKAKVSTELLSADLLKRKADVSPWSIGLEYFGAVPCYQRYLISSYMLKESMDKDDVVITRKPDLVRLISGRFAKRFPYTLDRKDMEDLLRQKEATHILSDSCYPETERYLMPYLNENPERFERISSRDIGDEKLRIDAGKMEIISRLSSGAGLADTGIYRIKGD
ncbi:MAG: glycosyltransferase family 39 protein [Deltaproteobacteria bacterium]|nr:glycosyltransferase family 39 protein [Deltaproteobacteria bacterium]